MSGGCLSSVDPGVELEYATEKWDSFFRSSTAFITTTTIESGSFVGAVPVMGWNVHSTAFSTSNPISSQLISETVTTFSTQTPSSFTAAGGSVSVRNSTDDNGQNDRLSKGSIAGIGVTAGVVSLIIMALVAWIVILKRRRSAEKRVNNELKEHVQPHGIDPDVGDSSFNRTRELDNSQIINELSHTNRFEMDAAAASVELIAAEVIAEPPTANAQPAGRRR